MKIVLENVVTSQRGRRGIGSYFQNLVQALARADRANEYVLHCHFWKDFEAKKREVLTIPAPNFSTRVSRFPQRAADALEWRARVPVLRHLLPPGTGIYHAIESRLPRLGPRIKTVVTVHDLIIQLFPHWHHDSLEPLRDACRRADRLIAISHNTKKDILRCYGVPDEKVRVVHYGLDHETFQPVRDPARLGECRSRLKLPERFLLTTGPFERRRNTERLLEAYSRLRRGGAARHIDLVLAGGKNYYTPGIEKLAHQLDLAAAVHFTGHLAPTDMACLYSLCEAFVYPSLYEGFGLTPLEALACGTPVVCSNAASLPEVTGKAAALVDPESPERLAEAVAEVLRDPLRRSQLAARGPEQAAKFTWDKAAAETLAVYRELGAA